MYEVIDEGDCVYWVQSLDDPDSKPLCISPSQFWQLLPSLWLGDPRKGAKAYSYFGTIVKRWCILYNDKNYKSKVKKVSTDELEKDDTHSYTLDQSSSNDRLSNFMDEYVEFASLNIYKLFPKPYDAKIADAILELFRKRESIDVFNKKVKLKEETIRNLFEKNYLEKILEKLCWTAIVTMLTLNEPTE